MKKEPISSKNKAFAVVGIGASAGGLKPFTELLKNLPPDTGMSFVIVSHMDPEHESVLPEILSKTTKMTVSQIASGMEIKPNQVYVIPPNADLAIFHGVFNIMPRTKTRGVYLPIDYFFRSLARDMEGKAIGIILSGMDSDGVLGLREIKAEGGITFAQLPEEAEYPAMPRNAINSGSVDFVLPVEEIAEELSRIGHHPYLAEAKPAEVNKVIPEGESDLLSRVFILLRNVTGVDFSYYKRSTIRRRITRRLLVNKIENLADYIQFLQESPTETNALYQDLLITVTEFFRDSEVFTAMKTEIFPALLKNKSADALIRIWIPGCSTGEEVYSVVITLLEFLQDTSIAPRIQVFATDINEAVIEKARAALYPDSIVSSVSPERLRRYFNKVRGGYQVNKYIREMCIFARHDITRDPPFSRLDMISFRNVLIYMDLPLQKKIIPMLHYALMPNGFLVLGTSESVGEFTNLFEVIDGKKKICKRKAVPARLPVEFATGNYRPENFGLPEQRTLSVDVSRPKFDILRIAEHILVDRFALTGVMIDNSFEIIQILGRTGRYLELPSGKASLNLLEMARGGLGLEVRTLVHSARASNVPVTKKGVKFDYEGSISIIDLEAIPIKGPMNEFYCLVLFKEEEAVKEPIEAEEPETPQEREVAEKKADELEIAQLKQELTVAKDYLQSIIEDKDATNEELKVANEEIQSSNEELQSINEELETAKEELQSSNEELSTVNDELQLRNLELSQVNDDLSNLLSSVNIPIVMVGRDLHIRRFTPEAAKVMNVIPSDIGRPITHLRPNVDIPDFEKSIFDVIDKLSIKEQEIEDKQGHWHLMHIRPYQTGENKIDGAVVAFLDIDTLKQNMDRLKESSEFGEALNRIDAILKSSFEIDEIIQGVLREAVSAIGAESAVLFEREDSGCVARYEYGMPKQVIGRRFTKEQGKYAKTPPEIGKPFVVNNTEGDERVDQAVMKEFSIKSFLDIILTAKGRQIGDLSLYHHSASVAFTDVQVDFASKLATSIALALENARLYMAERAIADTLQEALLMVPNRIKGIKFGSLYNSATDIARVGGDFYDLFEIENGKVGIVIGDVSGKGLGAAALTTTVRNAIKAHAYEGYSPAVVMTKANTMVTKNSKLGSFVTVFYGILDTDNGELTYCNAGHPAPIIRHKTSVEVLDKFSPLIGAFLGMTYMDETTALNKDDSLILYTDGIIEARANHEFFEEERLVDLVKSYDTVSVHKMPQAIFDRVTDFAHGGLTDDIAILTVALET